MVWFMVGSAISTSGTLGRTTLRPRAAAIASPTFRAPAGRARRLGPLLAKGCSRPIPGLLLEVALLLDSAMLVPHIPGRVADEDWARESVTPLACELAMEVVLPVPEMALAALALWLLVPTALLSLMELEEP
jgi:hypothetical protein